MNTGQTMLTIFAFALLMTTLTGFYRLMGSNEEDITSGQDGILAATIATSYMEVAQGLAYDERTDTSNSALHDLTKLTLPASLGPDDASEDSIKDFDDYDDFNGFVTQTEAGQTGRMYVTQFAVYYVNPSNAASISASRTFVKRMDMKTWRIFPVMARADTLRLSIVQGYFHFD